MRAKHWLVELVPAVFFGFDIMPETARKGGSQILQGSRPLFSAFSKGSEDETFLTIRHEAKWYFVPLGVL